MEQDRSEQDRHPVDGGIMDPITKSFLVAGSVGLFFAATNYYLSKPELASEVQRYFFGFINALS